VPSTSLAPPMPGANIWGVAPTLGPIHKIWCVMNHSLDIYLLLRFIVLICKLCANLDHLPYHLLLAFP
jgi:hypothetical protein